MIKKRLTRSICILITVNILAITCYASNDYSMAIGANVGTTGLGIEARTQIVENLYGRLGVNYFQYNSPIAKVNDSDDSTIHYKTKINIMNAPLMLDYHPIDNSGFRLSLGLAYNGNKITAKASPNKTLVLNGHTYTPEDLGSVEAKVTLGNTVTPVISVGYDNSLISDSPWSFNAEAGVIFAGKSKIKVSATGLMGEDKQAIDDLNRDANKDLDKAKKYLRLFPVLSVGFKYAI